MVHFEVQMVPECIIHILLNFARVKIEHIYWLARKEHEHCDNKNVVPDDSLTYIFQHYLKKKNNFT